MQRLAPPHTHSLTQSGLRRDVSPLPYPLEPPDLDFGFRVSTLSQDFSSFSNAFRWILFTEKRGVRLYWAHSKPQGPNDLDCSLQAIFKIRLGLNSGPGLRIPKMNLYAFLDWL